MSLPPLLTNRVFKMNSKEDQARLLDRLHRLQIDCSVLNDFIEDVLLTSGVCRRYTDELAYCNLKQCGPGKKGVRRCVSSYRVPTSGLLYLQLFDM